MSAADKRIAELLDRWLASVELHARYLKLDDAAYASAQDWPKHQRPTKWVVELARTRLLELQQHLDERRRKGDAAFAESLELMCFLTTLLGSEHVERFIPLAVRNPRPPPAARSLPGRPTPASTASPPPRRRPRRQRSPRAIRRRGRSSRSGSAPPRPRSRATGKVGDKMTQR